MADIYTDWSPELQDALTAPFLGAEEFVPRGLPKGHKRGDVVNALGLLFVGAPQIMARLNRIVGPAGWRFAAGPVGEPGERVVVTGLLTILGVERQDFGEAALEEGRSGNAELYKAAWTDAFRRCSRQFGLGLYAWCLEGVAWGKHDGYKWVEEPRLTDEQRNRAVAVARGEAVGPAPRPLPTRPPSNYPTTPARTDPAPTGDIPPRPASSNGVECEVCGHPCPQGVAVFSRQKFGRVLCRDHQAAGAAPATQNASSGEAPMDPFEEDR